MEVHDPPAAHGPPPDGDVPRGRRRLVLAGLTVATLFTVLFVLVTVWITHSVITDHWHQHHPWYYGLQVQTVVSAFTPITAFVAAGIAYLAARTTWRASLAEQASDRQNFEDQMVADQARHNEERDSETRRDLHTRFTTVSAQLAGEASMMRQAGVHAIAALADDWHAHDPNTRQIQACVDVLCSYLRRPWDPEDDTAAEERTVRETILTVLRQHLQPEASPSWSDCGLNLVGARLRDFDLTGAEIHRANFLWATFTGTTSFRGAKFTAVGKGRSIDFSGTTFTTADSLGIHFTDSEFLATEGGRIDFLGAKFRASDRLDLIGFDRAKFKATGEDSEIRFSSAEFSATGWHAGIRFAGAEFTADQEGNIGLSSAKFTASGDESWISFHGAKFFATGGGDISFLGSTFSATDKSATGEDVQGNRINFEGATFSATATPQGRSRISFHLATFSAAGKESGIDFKKAEFSANGQGSMITLNEATFSAAEGSRIDFGRPISFERANFEGTGVITFEDPREWVNVYVPWDDQDPPSVIRPRNWPPLTTGP